MKGGLSSSDTEQQGVPEFEEHKKGGGTVFFRHVRTVIAVYEAIKTRVNALFEQFQFEACILEANILQLPKGKQELKVTICRVSLSNWCKKERFV